MSTTTEAPAAAPPPAATATAGDPATTQAAPASPANPPPTGDPPPAGDPRPAWLPEKFADPAALAKAYGELESWKGSKQEQLKAEVLASLREGVPEKPDAYDFTVPEDLLPAGFKAEIPKDDPFLTQMKQTFHALGAKPEQFQQAAEAFLRWQVGNMPDLMAERSKLGEGAPERLAAVDAWLVKSLPDAEYHAVAAGMMTAEGIGALERLMKLATRGVQGVPGGGGAAPINQAEAQAILANPNYRADTPEGTALRAKFAGFVEAGGKVPGYSR